MILSEDYSDMLRALSDEKVEYLLIGAHAVAAHGIPRAIWTSGLRPPRKMLLLFIGL